MYTVRPAKIDNERITSCCLCISLVMVASTDPLTPMPTTGCIMKGPLVEVLGITVFVMSKGSVD